MNSTGVVTCICPHQVKPRLVQQASKHCAIQAKFLRNIWDILVSVDTMCFPSLQMQLVLQVETCWFK